MKRYVVGILLVGVALLTACTFLGPIGPVVLYEETFTDPQNWLVSDSTSRAWWVENGKYHALVKAEDLWVGSYNGTQGPFDDFQLDVDMEQVSGPADNGYGVLFRAVDGSNFYRFAISGDGYACFHKVVNGARTEITPWMPSAAIHTGNAVNHIRIIAEGNSFSFYINDALLLAETDTSFASGHVGFAAMMYDPGQTHIAFDNLLLKSLE